MARKVFRLTSERLELVRHFVRYRYLRMSHLYGLYGTGEDISERAVRRLVRDFFAHGYLYRRVAPADPKRPVPGSEFAYWLSVKGVALAEQAGLADVPLPCPRATIARTLEHELAITDFHLGVRRECESRGLTLHWEQYNLRRGVNPDAMFAVTDLTLPEAESTSYYFLEVELNPASGYRRGQPALLRRLERYAAYQGSEECLKDWKWFSEFRVFVLIPRASRRLLIAREHLLPGIGVLTSSVSEHATACLFGRPPSDFRSQS